MVANTAAALCSFTLQLITCYVHGLSIELMIDCLNYYLLQIIFGSNFIKKWESKLEDSTLPPGFSNPLIYMFKKVTTGVKEAFSSHFSQWLHVSSYSK